ncbi:MAG TPA: 50S ribosomal protein L11 methyltransferase, partial [Candidatus Binataceae bacterium]|nr:50S ribosomal protein L11 methyltransferase [Candidatus Binataceae bacterium]
KLGVAHVIAIDTDQASLTNAKENAELNRATEKIHFSTTPLEAIRGRFAVIAANILSSTLIRMAPDLTVRLRSRGHLVLSGILRHEAQSVADAYVERRLACVGWNDYGAWTTLVFEK